jgi:hypothetical protein
MWDSIAVEQYDKGISEDSRLVDIDGLEEARCATLVQSARYLEGIRRYHDRNVKERSLNIGDLVLHRIQNTERLHKLSSPWEGPFTVAKVTDQAPTASRRLKVKTSAIRGISTSSVDSTPSLSTTPGAQVCTTTPRPLCCKRPPGPGTSLRTTVFQDPALTATNGSWAAHSDKGLQQRSTERPCTPRSSLYGY